MGKGKLKHDQEIFSEILNLLNQQNGVISQNQIQTILEKYYSNLYIKNYGLKKVEEELCERKIANLVKVNIGTSNATRNNKHAKLNPFLSIYLSTHVPNDRKQQIIADYIRKSMPNFRPMTRTISKELLLDNVIRTQKRPDIMDFPSVKFRSMLLHGFLLTTFKNNPFTLEMIINAIPYHLCLQIIRNFDLWNDKKLSPYIFSVIPELNRSFQFEIDILIPSLRFPFQPLIKQNSVCPTARVVIPFYNINKFYDFYNDPNAYSDYWILHFSLVKEKLDQFPVNISARFEPFIFQHFKTTSINKLPFFPHQVETFSKYLGISPSISSYSIQKLFKKKLRTLQCSKELFLESKVFPLNKYISFLITGASIVKTAHPKFAESLSTPFNIDDSIRSLAKLYAASQLTEEGYILNKRSNFKLFKTQVKKWVESCNKFTNLFESLKESSYFSSLIENEKALLIEEMRFPYLYYERYNSYYPPTSQIIIDLKDEEEEDTIENIIEEQQNHQRSNSAYFVSESVKHLNSIIKSTSIHSEMESISSDNNNTYSISNLNKTFSQTFPDQREDLFEHNTIGHNTNNHLNEPKPIDNFNSEFSTTHIVDSPLDQSPSEENILDPLASQQSDDSIVEYPKLNYNDFIESTQSNFLSLFLMKNRMIDLPLSVSVAVEFLKIVLSTKSGSYSNDLKLRQTLHFSEMDSINAIWHLNVIDLYARNSHFQLPRCSGLLGQPDSFTPHPLFIPYCEQEDSDLKIRWNNIKMSSSPSLFIFDDEDEIHSDDEYRPRYKRKKVQLSKEITKYKKRVDEFSFEKTRRNYPKLPELIITDFALNSQLYDTDPISNYCFGEYESEIPFLEDFELRFIMNLVNSAGVYGIGLSEILNAHGISFNSISMCEKIIQKVKQLCTMNFICRVPSSLLETRYSRFLPCNTICKPIQKKVELVPVHIWTNYDGMNNPDVKSNLLKGISTYIFGHEYCDFTDIIQEFYYVSPYDLCILLESLECDEIITSQYYLRQESTLFEEESDIPIPPFESFELFLLIINQQRSLPQQYPTYRRVFKTHRSMFPNLSVIHSLSHE